ncbi:mitochondrial thiamine pyrophosphate carrier-like [Diabrotica virgifera virgifera]|uniref:Mitochondrial thiamine pyrophosphate carrier n=1 Tax=Diabrotica virgifera virgifera TaxID=50390 RepID=A0A6P7FGN1_DIAVI|nr:mitochondrial thiamine pyrophosphate carrier-like [Diabrotica virgifera virgifera]
MVEILESKDKLNSLDHVLAGAGSGCITRALTQPLDVIKIRFQLQVEPISPLAVSKYKSIPQAVGLIIREEGLKAFWKGHIPAQWLSITYGMVQFSTFEFLVKKGESLDFGKKHSHLINFMSGGIAGSTATLLSFPFDVIRTRLVAQSEQKMIYKEGIIHSCEHILKNEKPSTLFRGLLPSLFQITPHAGVQFMTYKLFNDMYSLLFHQNDVTLSNSVVSGSLAGLCAKTAIYPLDLVKKRMQIQGFEKGREIFGKVFRCKGMVDALGNVYRDEGAVGFFKGLSPSLLKACVSSALYFGTYELCCDIIKVLKGI